MCVFVFVFVCVCVCVCACVCVRAVLAHGIVLLMFVFSACSPVGGSGSEGGRGGGLKCHAN